MEFGLSFSFRAANVGLYAYTYYRYVTYTADKPIVSNNDDGYAGLK